MRRLSLFVCFIFMFFTGLVHSSPIWSDCALDLASGSSKVTVDWDVSGWGTSTLYYQRFFLKSQEYTSFKEVAVLVGHISGGRALIGIGRSPHPYMTYSSLLPSSNVVNLAISDFRNRPLSLNNSASLPDVYLKNAKSFAPLAEDAQKVLFEYFDHRIFAFLARQTGTIFLTDIGESGASLFSMQKYLSLYAASRKLSVSFESIIVTTSFFQNNVKAMASFFSVQPHIAVNDNPFVTETLKSSRWDRFAEFNRFGFHDILRTGRTSAYDRFSQQYFDFGQAEPNPSHQRFRTAIQANMLGDPEVRNIEPIDLKVAGVHWNPLTRRYEDSVDEVIHLSTGD